MKSLKVLISAYACLPNEGSEPGVGWNTAREVSNYHQVWVLTRESNRPAIENFCQNNKLDNLTFVYCEPHRLLSGLQPAHIPHYYSWQAGAYSTAKQLHHQVGFDIAHHVTYVRYSTPSFLCALPIPFVWGPVGGAESMPRSFWHDLGIKSRAYEMLRTVVHRAGELDPFTRATARHSTIARATTAETAQRLSSVGAPSVQTHSALGLSQKELVQLGALTLPAPQPIRFISIARLLHWKGLHLSLQAFAKASFDQSAEYWILGDGPERDALERLAANLGITAKVKFFGALPRSETLQQLGNCHILVHPSLHDSGGLVCLEAMAASRPVVCLDTGGPALQVNEQTGIKVAVKKPQQVVSDLAFAMTNLAKDENRRVELGEAARKRVTEDFSWQKKGQQLSQLYVDLISH